LRVETKAGHGAGRPTDKIIDDVADRYAFLVKTLNFTPSLPAAATALR
jgi:prolyl oligopeptidase